MTGADNLTTTMMVLIGLAIFLYGMNQLEEGIRDLGLDAFKRWIANSTSSPVSSAALGVAITAIVQSSSMVSLLVLAFASAGVLPLYNAVGVILGANLGTTVTGWMVAAIGFKLSLSTLALPLLALGGVGQLLALRFSGLRGIGRAVFGLGLIIFGLDVMKGAVEGLQDSLDIGLLQGHGTLVYFLAGAVVAALIQSSSATMMLTLAGLHGGLLDLPAAAAVVIGADLGTTSTTALGSIGGHAVKRQLALGHVIFNLLVDLSALVLLLPLFPALLAWLNLEDPLYGLVFFHSLFNVVGLLVFLPLLKPYARWLGRWFAEDEDSALTIPIHSAAVPEAALIATARMLERMRLDATVLALHEFHLRPEQLQLPAQMASVLEGHYDQRISVPDRYALLKGRESELLAFSFELQKASLSEEQVVSLDRQLREARAIVYSSKSQMDIRENLASMRHASNEEVTKLYKFHRQYARKTYRRFLGLDATSPLSASSQETLEQWLRENDAHYEQGNERARKLLASGQLTGMELSSLLNVNRDIHHSVKELIRCRMA